MLRRETERFIGMRMNYYHPARTAVLLAIDCVRLKHDRLRVLEVYRETPPERIVINKDPIARAVSSALQPNPHPGLRSA